MHGFFYGVIEGFYGRQWSWRDRGDYAQFLAEFGFDCYIYAPKGDAFLRSRWREPLPSGTCQQLRKLSETYRAAGLRWGLGLSPLGLSERFSAADAASLVEKVQAINTLSPDILCILFDDMRGDIPGLAKRQLDIVAAILDCSAAGRHIVCPTYYSFDPVLELVFGEMPANYLQDLGAGLPAEVDIFWTGNRVISARIDQADIRHATQMLGRQPVLWDNYPVNDGKQTCGHLHLRPYQGRSGQLSRQARGHLVNPMNQPQLSKLVLQSLQGVYHSPPLDTASAWRRGLLLLKNTALEERLANDAPVFQDRGLDGLSTQEKSRLAEQYARIPHPAAREVVEWLRGNYQFDPACLTG